MENVELLHRVGRTATATAAAGALVWKAGKRCGGRRRGGRAELGQVRADGGRGQLILLLPEPRRGQASGSEDGVRLLGEGKGGQARQAGEGREQGREGTHTRARARSLARICYKLCRMYVLRTCTLHAGRWLYLHLSVSEAMLHAVRIASAGCYGTRCYYYSSSSGGSSSSSSSSTVVPGAKGRGRAAGCVRALGCIRCRAASCCCLLLLLAAGASSAGSDLLLLLLLLPLPLCCCCETLLLGWRAALARGAAVLSVSLSAQAPDGPRRPPLSPLVALPPRGPEPPTRPGADRAGMAHVAAPSWVAGPRQRRLHAQPSPAQPRWGKARPGQRRAPPTCYQQRCLGPPETKQQGPGLQTKEKKKRASSSQAILLECLSQCRTIGQPKPTAGRRGRRLGRSTLSTAAIW